MECFETNTDGVAVTVSAISRRSLEMSSTSIPNCKDKFKISIFLLPIISTEILTSTSISTAEKMLKATSHLPIPIYVTTQNRARLGNTVSELLKYIYPESEPLGTATATPKVRADIDKKLFSMITPEIKALLTHIGAESAVTGAATTAKATDPLDVIIVGIESHICVTQTTLDLLALGHRVYVLADGVSSCNPEERPIALARLRDAGAVVTTSEGVLFEVLGDAGRDGFKGVSGLVKETKEETKGALEVFCKM